MLAAAGGVAIAFRLVPWLLPLAALACIPVRIGVHVGGSGSKLLVPLYVVIIAAAMYLGWELVRGDERARELGHRRMAARRVPRLDRSLARRGARTCTPGAIELLAFYVPFTILALGIARLPWSRLGVTVLYVQVVAMGLGFAIVGFYQYQTRDIFQNAKVINSNAYAPFFRVNSVFWDPSVYGRFLVVAIVPSAVLLVRERVRLLTPVVVAAIVVLWLGLLISFSQSSFAALLVGHRRRDHRRVAVAGARRGRGRRSRARRDRGLRATAAALDPASHLERAEQRDERALQPRRERHPHRTGASRSGCRRRRLQARVR